MKIGIIAPSPVPFTIGGAEKLWWGLLRHINANTPHQAELVKLPTREHSFWDLVESYRAFSELDVSHFDLVISTKYPAWMVSHPRHICYMQHRLRGLYDTYHFTRLPTDYAPDHPELAALCQLLCGPATRERLPEVFTRLANLRYRVDLPQDAFAFPGPFIRQLVHFCDAAALNDSEIESFHAISATVARRQEYFPADAAINVIYHPSNLDELRCGDFRYLFTVSRLDEAKRITMLAEAMRYVAAECELRIAGEGPARARLAELAAADSRIKLIGFRSDAEVIDDYADALAVPFIPYDEDYGLITIEAMLSGKAVLTTSDAGGPTEFVEHNRTGLCVAPDPKELGSAIQWMATNKGAVQRMGAAARRRVQPITWERTVASLLGGASARKSRALRTSKRRKLTVATTFAVTPVRGGGQARIFHIYKNLWPEFETDLITLGGFNEPPFIGEIAPGLREIRVPKSAAHTEAENNISAEVEWFSITDVVFPMLFHLTPQYVEALERSCRKADAVVASHPYPLAAIESTTDKPIWHESQDVEYLLKSDVIPKTSRGLELIDAVRRVESRCCEQAALIMACSEDDKEQLARLYGVDGAKTRVVANGTDFSDTPFVPRTGAAELKGRLGLADQFLAIFVGSWHQPNLDAIEVILKVAREREDVQFLVLGSSCAAFKDRKIPANVGLFGVVEQNVKTLAFAAADLALNPMQNGSGTNLKMLEYAAAGVPILSTRVGIRGLGFRPDVDVFTAPLDDFTAAIRRVQQTSPARLQRMATRARRHAEIHFDWRNISRRFLQSL